MAEFKMLKPCLNSVILNLKKLELELMCPNCLKLLELPVLLPCTHVFCSHCTDILIENGCECPSCETSFLREDLRPAAHIKSLVDICKDMNSAVAASFSCKKSKVNFDKNMPTIEIPVPGNNYLEEMSQRESIHDMPRGYLFDTEMHSSNIMTPAEGESDKSVAQRSKRQMESLGEEALFDKREQHNTPSFGSIKDSNCDNGGNRNQRQIERSILMVKEKEVGNMHSNQVDIRKSKVQKLNSECDVGSKDGISSADLTTHNHDTGPYHASCSDTHSFDASRYLSANRIVECVFCHSFRITEGSGNMLHILNGNEVDLYQATQPNVFHVHEKCIGWAPQVYYSHGTFKNLEVELSRASKIKCNSCGLKGAALGCYVSSCQTSYHVPCAYEILECRWDCENFHVLCPAHSSHEMPCDRPKAKSNNNAKHSLDISGPSEDQTSPATPKNEHLSSSDWGRDWILCASTLSKEEKDLVNKLACISEAAVCNLWKQTVTHVLASVDEHGRYYRTSQVLMAILTGKWVLSIEWVKACIKAGHYVPEEPYEITHDVHDSFNGPKMGRLRAMKKAPKLFSGSNFYFADDFEKPSLKRYLKDLVLTGGGKILKKNDLVQNPNVFIVYSTERPLRGNTRGLDEFLKRRSEQAESLAADVGGRALGHSLLLDNIAAYKFELN